jgi:hypothetical protein
MFACWLWGNFKGMEGCSAEVASFFTVFAERCPWVCAQVIWLVDVRLDMERQDILGNVVVS